MRYYSKYDLRGSLIKNIITKKFDRGEPLQATTKTAQQVLLHRIKDTLESELIIKVEELPYSKTRRGEFEVKFNSKMMNDVTFRLEFDEKGILNLTRYYDDKITPLSKIEDILFLKEELPKIAVIEEERYRLMEEKKAQKTLKNDKIKVLKRAAIVAKIKELAQAEKIRYNIDDSFTYKVKLTVRLSNSHRMEVDILYSNYQNVLQHLQTAIQSIKELLAKSVPIKVKCSVQEIGCISWTIPSPKGELSSCE